MVEIIVHTLNGPKTIGRYNSLAVEDGPSKTLKCVIMAIQKFVPGEVSTMSYPEFLSMKFNEYRATHFEGMAK